MNAERSSFAKDSIGLYTLAKREILRFLIVGHQTILPPLVSSTLFLFIFGLSVGKNVAFNHHGIDYLSYIVPGIVTMYLINGSFENTSSSLFISRWHNHIQEVLLSPLSYIEMVLGLLAGGVARGVIVSLGVFTIASLLAHTGVAHPILAVFFMLSISVIFSCLGMMAALWAKDFGMLSIWGTYVITPLVFLGGVFNPISMLPESLQKVALWNPMYQLVSGVRFSILGIADTPIWISIALTATCAAACFAFTVHLFRIGYRLRT